jgi:hypothetical protein
MRQQPINLAVYLPQPAAQHRPEPHTAADPSAEYERPLTRICASQGPFSLHNAEGVGFEPTMTLTRHSGFQDPYGKPRELRKRPRLA